MPCNSWMRARRSHPSDYLHACAALARGRVCLATGDGDPRACLREALAGFDRAQLPMELASLAPRAGERARRHAARSRDGRGPRRARGVREAASGAARRRGRGRLAIARRPADDRRNRRRGPDQTRGRGARAPRPRPLEPRDLGSPLHQPQDSRAPRRATCSPSSACAAGPRPPPTPPAPNKPPNRGPPRCARRPIGSW